MTDSASYFSADSPVERASRGGTWVDLDRDVPVLEMTPGLRFFPIPAEGMLMNIVRFEPNTVAPVHTHEEE